MPSITCTQCGAVLKTPTAIPPGKKVKCPKCQQAFVVQADEEEEPKKSAAEEENPFATGGGDEEDAPKKKAKGGDDDGNGDDGDTPKKGKGDKKKSNTTMIVIIAVVVVFLCCCGCGTVGTIFRTAIAGLVGLGEVAAKAANDKANEDAGKKKGDEAQKPK